MISVKFKPVRKIISSLLSTALVAAGITGTAGIQSASAAGFTPPQSVVDHLNQDDWTNVQSILSGIYGSVTSPLRISDLDKGSYTTGQLLGNGDIGAIAAGVSTTSQQFYFGKNDFWGTLHAQGGSVKDNQGILSGGGLDIWPTTAAGSQAASVFNMKQDLLNAQVTTNLQLKDNGGADAAIRMNSWTADTDNVFVTEITNQGGGPITLNTKQWVPAMAYASGSATDLTDAQSTYPYTGGIDASGTNPVLWTTRDTNAGATGNTSGFRSRMATATTVVGAALTNTKEKIEANDYFDSNKGKYYNSLGEAGDFTVNAGSTVYVVSYFASSSGANNAIKSSSQVQADAVSGISAYTSPDAIAQLKADHLNWWKTYWLKSFVQFNDPELNKYYYSSLYILGSSHRPTSANGKVNPQNLPGSMYGEWIPADNMGWGGRYFLNYNQQAHYYASGSINRIETAVPYNRVIAFDLPWQINNAAAQGHDGAAHNRTLSPFHLMAGTQPQVNPVSPPKTYGFSSGSTDQKSNGMFAAIPMVFYYEYTLDDNYLKNTLYPYLKQLMNFYSSYVLKTDDGNGQYHYSVLGSSIHEGDAADINPDLDIGAIKLLSDFLTKHAPAMGEDQANVARWKDMADHTAFPEAMLPKGIFNAANTGNLVPTLIATDYQSPNQPHVDMIEPGDQPVELEGVVFPVENVQMLDGDKDLLQKVLNTLEYMNAWAAGGFAGWSSQNNGFPKVYPIAARAGWPAADLLTKFKAALSVKLRGSNLTYYQSGGASETVGAMEGLDSMLLQSNTSPSVPSTIWAFPNWDKSRSASYERLGAMGNVEVSSAYDSGSQSVSYVDLNSKRDGKIALVNPWTVGNPVIQAVNADKTLGAAVSYTISGGKLIFDAQKGVRYMVMNDTSDSTAHTSGISLDKYSASLIVNGANGSDSATVKATLSGNPGDSVNWTSSDSSMATVTGSGNTATIKAVGTGPAKVANVTVTAKSAQDGGIMQTVKVKVADASTVPADLKLISPAKATIYGPDSTSASNAKVTGTDRLQLTAQILPGNAYDKRILWTTGNPNVAMVDKNGLVIARGAGTATITGTSMANPALPPVATVVTVTGAGADYSSESNLQKVLDNAKTISPYAGDKTSGGGFTRASNSPNWEGMQESFQIAYINALGVKAKYSGYSTYNISRDTAYFAAIALNEAIRTIDPSKAIELSSVDKSALVAALATASKLTADNFDTPQQWADLQAAQQTAQDVNNNVNATQDDVDAALTALQAALAKATMPMSAGSIPSVALNAGTAAVYGTHLVQIQAPVGSKLVWTVSNPDGSAAANATVDQSGLLYATAEGDYKVTAQPATGPATVLTVTFNNLAAMPNLAVTGNGNYFGSTSSGSYPPKNVFDGNPSTFFDHSTAAPYVGWDFGNPVAVNVLRFLPRSGTNAARIFNAKFQGSNESPTAGYVDLLTITDNPSTANANSWYVKALNNTTGYRYYRWLGTNGSHGNVAEIQLYINIDKTALANELVSALALQEGNYTEDSWNALQVVLPDAVDVNGNPNAIQSDINTEAESLQAALEGLQVAPGGALAVANGITSIAAPARDAVSLTLPAVPEGFTVAVKSSDHPAVIGTDGRITPPFAPTTVNLVLEVTRTSDGLKASTASIPVAVPAASTAAEIAGAITSLAAPAKGATSLAMPAVPTGFTVAIKSTDNADVVKTDGTIVPPKLDTTVNLVLTVTRTADGSAADTASIAVMVPSYDVTPPVTAAQIDLTGQNGWYKANVSVTLTAQDDVSGVAKTEYRLAGEAEWKTYTNPVVLTNEGQFTLQYRSVDKAGNVEAAKDQVIRIDKTAPTFTVTVNGVPFTADTAFLDNQKVSFNIEGADTGSGVADGVYTLDGQPYANGSLVDLAGKPGVHMLRIVVNDVAGNVTDTTIAFKVDTNLASISSLIDRFTESGDLKGPLVPQLRNSLDQAQHQLDKGDKDKASKHMEDFLKHLDNTAMRDNTTDAVRSFLSADANALITSWTSK